MSNKTEIVVLKASYRKVFDDFPRNDFFNTTPVFNNGPKQMPSWAKLMHGKRSPV